MTPAQEIDGYRNDVAYNHDYHRELAPEALKLLTLARGWAFPSERPLRYLELGYGNGVSLNIHAAATPGEFWGTDIGPQHVETARALASASGSGLRLLDQPFADLLKRTDLPRFDIIVAHGVWSWVSRANRELILDILRTHLGDGGLFFLSTVAYPSEAELVPLQRLLRAQRAADPRAALDLAVALRDAGSPYFAAGSAAGQRLEALKGAEPGYLVHEYLHAHWQPSLFAETAATLAGAGLRFVSGHRLTDRYDDLIHPPATCAMLAAIDDPLLRETARDFLKPKRLRFDLFLKGEPASADTNALRQQRFVLAAPATHPRLDAPPYRAILERLAARDGRPKSLDQLDVPGADPIRSLARLIDAGAMQPAQADEVAAAAAPACARLNVDLLHRSLTGDEIQFLASPVTGGGIQLSRAERLFLGAWHRGARTPNDWVKAATEAPLPVGTPVPQLLKEALYFQTRLPGLRALGLIGQES